MKAGDSKQVETVSHDGLLPSKNWFVQICETITERGTHRRGGNKKRFVSHLSEIEAVCERCTKTRWEWVARPSGWTRISFQWIRQTTFSRRERRRATGKLSRLIVCSVGKVIGWGHRSLILMLRPPSRSKSPSTYLISLQSDTDATYSREERSASTTWTVTYRQEN